jgi:hypothetical protein
MQGMMKPFLLLLSIEAAVLCNFGAYCSVKEEEKGDGVLFDESDIQNLVDDGAAAAESILVDSFLYPEFF